jgi:hypothetical protein
MHAKEVPTKWTFKEFFSSWTLIIYSDLSRRTRKCRNWKWKKISNEIDIKKLLIFFRNSTIDFYTSTQYGSGIISFQFYLNGIKIILKAVKKLLEYIAMNFNEISLLQYLQAFIAQFSLSVSRIFDCPIWQT